MISERQLKAESTRELVTRIETRKVKFWRAMRSRRGRFDRHARAMGNFIAPGLPPCSLAPGDGSAGVFHLTGCRASDHSLSSRRDLDTPLQSYIPCNHLAVPMSRSVAIETLWRGLSSTEAPVAGHVSIRHCIAVLVIDMSFTCAILYKALAWSRPHLLNCI